MATASVNGGRFTVRVTYTNSEDIASNTSTITVHDVEIRSNQGDDDECWVAGSVSFGGKNAVWMDISGSHQCEADLSEGWSSISGTSRNSVSLQHNNDGTLQTTMYVYVDVYNFKLQRFGIVDGAAYITLPTIPRASGISATSPELDSAMVISISKPAQSHTSTVSWQCGGQSGTIANQSSEETFQWTPPLSLAAESPNAAHVSITMKVDAYSGSVYVGTNSVTVQCPIPAKVVPTISASVTDVNGHVASFGGYVQGKSKVRVVSTAAGVYGSSITQVKVVCGAVTANGGDVSIVPTQSGSVTITITATDSRGRSASTSKQITVLAYAAPSISIGSLNRCSSNGTEQADGAYCKVVFSAKCTSLSGNNKIIYKLLKRQRGTSSWTQTEITGLKNNAAVTNSSFVSSANIDVDYECSVSVTDSFGTVTGAVLALNVAFALMDFDRSKKAVGIGMRAINQGAVSVGIPIDMGGNRITDVADPEEAGDVMTRNAVLSMLFPVGAVFFSTVNICGPAALGGTWESRTVSASPATYAWVRTK